MSSSAISIGYVPYSEDLSHPADRRRVGVLSGLSRYKLVTESPLESKVLILSNAANFDFWLHRAKQPVILDLVDSYLGYREKLGIDVARNILRSIHGKSDLKWITYTRHLKYAIRKSSAVVVASPEQRHAILDLNPNVSVILDSHAELSASDIDRSGSSFTKCFEHKYHLLWEGMATNLKHLGLLSDILEELLCESELGMYVVTSPHFFRWSDNYGLRETSVALEKLLPQSNAHVHLIPWSIANLSAAAADSKLGLIPISPFDQFATGKSENKLLSMWQLQLPTLHSPIPSYLRVAQSSEVNGSCGTSEEWREGILKSIGGPTPPPKNLEKMNEYLRFHHSLDSIREEWIKVISSVSET